MALGAFYAIQPANGSCIVLRLITCLNCTVFQALYLLLQCGHNIDEALHRHRLQSGARTGFGLFSLVNLVSL